MKRCDYGAGSITQVADDRFRLRVAAGVDFAGRRRSVNETYRGNVTGARRRLAELVTLYSRRGANSSITLAQAIDVWLAESAHAHATRANYDRARTRIPPRMLATPAGKVDTHDLDQLYRLVETAHGPYATHQLHALISGAYTNAMRLRWVHDHPARYVRLPKLVKRRSTTPTALQARAIIAAGADDQQRLWLRLALVLGRRHSEILAIRWSDVDLAAHVVHVRRSLELDRTEKETKTGDHAELAIDPVTAAQLRSWQNAQRERALAAGMPLASDPWLFSQLADSSQPWRPDLATRRWAATRRRAGVPDTIRLTDFRKANTTNLIAGGADVRTVAGRSGHDPAMALGTYAGLVDEANRRAAEIIARVVDG